MTSVPGNLACAQCGRLFGPENWTEGALDGCLLCAHMFCREHLISRQGLATCAECLKERERLESESVVSEADRDRIVQLIGRDVLATLGDGFDDIISEEASRLRLFACDRSAYEDEVVHAIQHDIHNAFVDTAWPACPHHPNHPLGCSGGWWRCDRLHRAVAPIGELSR